MIQETTGETRNTFWPTAPNLQQLTSIYNQVGKVNTMFLKAVIPYAAPVLSTLCQNALLTSSTIVYLASKAIQPAYGEVIQLTSETPDEFQAFMNCLFDCLANQCTILSRNPFAADGDCSPYINACHNLCAPHYYQAIAAMNATSLEPTGVEDYSHTIM